jgi:predicted DNA-binding transcriptional regulator AlpA
MTGVLPNAPLENDPLLNAREVAVRLGVSEDWVWDHSTRRAPFLPAIWLSPGALRFRRSAIDSFISERERLSRIRRKRR